MNRPINVELKTFEGNTICENLGEGEDFPAIVVIIVKGLSSKAFYKIGSHTKGMVGVYQECVTTSIFTK